MQREAMSRFAPSTAQECTTVLDCAGAEARQEIAQDAPPPLIEMEQQENLLWTK